jgi:hypothetical protein
LRVFFEKLREKRNGFLAEKGFCKQLFVLKMVSNMDRRDKDKPSKGLECYMKVRVSFKSV